MTQQEYNIEKAWQDYAKEIGLPESLNYASKSIVEIAIKQAFKAGANFALGKQEKEAEKSKGKLMCLRDRTKVCNKCHACNIDTDAWHSMYSR